MIRPIHSTLWADEPTGWNVEELPSDEPGVRVFRYAYHVIHREPPK